MFHEMHDKIFYMNKLQSFVLVESQDVVSQHLPVQGHQ